MGALKALSLVSKQISGAKATSRFKYHPLDNSSQTIRLIDIAPGQGSETISCRVFHALLATAPRYDAISYTWGNQSRTRSILCNERPFPVTESLHQVLRRFRQPKRPVTFWIDQICINQDDIKERSEQTQLMSRIYQSAEKVLVWLGEEDSRSGVGLQLAQRALAVLSKRPGLNLYIDNLEGLGLPRWNHQDWIALGALMVRPWFKRIWVIQEVVMAKKALMVCGQETLTWDQFAQLLRCIRFAAHMRTFSGQEIASAQTVQRVLDIDRIRMCRLLDNPRDLLNLLLSFRSSEATDPRDKVFALLGMSTSDMKPDYSRTTEEVYVDIAKQLIHGLRPLDHSKNASKFSPWEFALGIIYSAGKAYQHKNLPSWVPDWSTDFASRPLWAAKQARYRAGGDISGEMEVLPDNTLHIKGKACDTIRMSGTPLDHRISEDDLGMYEAMAAWLFEANLLTSYLSRSYPTKESHDQAFKRTLMANRIADHIGYRVAKADDVESHFRALGFMYALQIPRYEEYLVPEASTQSWHQKFFAEMHGRAFIITTKGYMGLAPRGTKEGDVIGVLAGGSVPVILRPHGQGYTLIGECYIHGMMNGEMMEDNSIPQTDIKIK